AIGLSLLHCSSDRRSSTATARGLRVFRVLFDSDVNSLHFEWLAAGLRFGQQAELANAPTDRRMPSLRLTVGATQFFPGSAHSIQPPEPLSRRLSRSA